MVFLAFEEAAMTVFMDDLKQQVVSSASPYVWSVVLAFATVVISIALLYLARFSAKLEVKDLADLRSMFDRFPAWGKRASWAQQNSFEAFSLHAPAALLAAIAALNNRCFRRLRLSQPSRIRHFVLPTSAPMCSMCHWPDPFAGCWVFFAVVFSTAWD